MDEPTAAWVQEEQRYLWHDLDEAIRQAANGAWSIRASNVAARIVSAARLVGPTRNGAVPWSLVAGGVYEAVLAAGGLTSQGPTPEEFARYDVTMCDHGGTRETLRPMFAATVAALSDPVEREYINER